jgi:anti-sigma regulatory factor (Ser/Thr protein kinase)
MTISRTFGRRVGVLPDIVAFTAEAFVQQGIDSRLRLPVDFAVEELFTNMVKYGVASTSDVQIDVAAIDGGVEVTLTDYDVEPFDVTQAPDAEVGLPIEVRQPGGLGLHLIRRLVDSIEYEYSKEQRRSRITFRKFREDAAHPGAGAAKEG